MQFSLPTAAEVIAALPRAAADSKELIHIIKQLMERRVGLESPWGDCSDAHAHEFMKAVVNASGLATERRFTAFDTSCWRPKPTESPHPKLCKLSIGTNCVMRAHTR